MLNEHIRLDGKTAVVTGASRGIGEAAARRLAAAGANVVLLARSAGDIQRIAGEINAAVAGDVDSDPGGRALFCQCDVSKWSEVEAALGRATAQFGGVDILINNAGVIDPVARIEDADPEAWGRVVDINLKGAFHVIRGCVPLMKSNQSIIVNISSGAASSALEGWSHYCSTKAALLMLTQCVHHEYADQGIRCSGLSPGTVATGMQKSIAESKINPVSELDWSAHISPDVVAEAVLWLCTDAASSYAGTDFSLKSEEGRNAIGLV